MLPTCALRGQASRHNSTKVHKSLFSLISCRALATTPAAAAADSSHTSAATPPSRTTIPQLLRTWLGFAGPLPFKYATSPSLHQARLSLLQGPPPSTTPGSTWTDHCDFDELCRVMGHSWAGTAQQAGEACKEWMTSHMTYPNQETKVLLSTYFMGSSVAQALRSNGIVLASRSAAGHITSVAILSEKRYEEGHGLLDSSNESTKQGQDSSSPESFWDQVTNFWWELGVTARLTGFTIPKLLACEIYQEQQSQSAIKAAALGGIKQSYYDDNNNHRRHFQQRNIASSKSPVAPENPFHIPGSAIEYYWNIQMVAVNPHHQGQGHGQELMQRLGQLADAAGVHCHLEAAGIKMPQFYKQAGYTEQSILCIENPTNEVNGIPLQVSMMRRAPLAIVEW